MLTMFIYAICFIILNFLCVYLFVRKMGSTIIGRCNYNGKIVTFLIFGSTSFSQVWSCVGSRFHEFVVGTFDLTYVVLVHPLCLLQHMDVQRIIICDLWKEKTSIDINIRNCMVVETWTAYERFFLWLKITSPWTMVNF